MAIVAFPYSLAAGSQNYNAVANATNEDGANVVIDTNTGLLYSTNALWGNQYRGEPLQPLQAINAQNQYTGSQAKYDGPASSLKMLSAGYTPMSGYFVNGSAAGGDALSNVFVDPATQKYYIDPSARNFFGGLQKSIDPATGGILLGQGDAAVGQIIQSAVAGAQAAHIDTGSFLSNLMEVGGPVFALATMGASGALGGLGEAGVEAAGSGALDAVYGAGAGGFGAPLTAYEAALPISAGVDAAALGATGAGAAGAAGATSILDTISNYLPSLSDLAKKAAINAITQYSKTGKVDLEQIVTSLAAGAAGNVAGGVAGSAFDDKLLSSIASGAARGVTTAGLSGGDVEQAALMGAATSGAGYLAQGTSIPTSAVNALITSAVTGKPLAETLVNAGLNVAANAGIGAVKDSFTQTPAPVTTGDAAAAMNPTSDTVENPTSGLDSVTSTSDSTSNEVAPIVAGTSDVAPSPTYNTDFTGSGIDSTGVPPEPIDTYTTPPLSDQTLVTDTADTNEPTTPVTNPVTTPVTKPVTTPVTKPTSTAKPSALPSFAPVQPTSTSQPSGLGWLTDPNKSGLLTVKRDNMSNPFLEDQLPPQSILYADGGSVDPFKPISDLFDPTSKTYPQFVNARPSVLSNKKLSSSTALSHVPLKTMYPSIARGMASGGLPSKYEEATPKGHKPEFITGVTGFYANGKGTGQSDDIPALLHDGDYVMDAETVSALGDGSSKAGREVLDKFRNQVPHTSKNGGRVIPAKIADGEYVFPAAFVTSLGKGENKRGSEILDGLREKLREHKRKAPLNKIPPKAKSPLEYLKSKV